jgi:hypothetical protein
MAEEILEAIRKLACHNATATFSKGERQSDGLTLVVTYGRYKWQRGISMNVAASEVGALLDGVRAKIGEINAARTGSIAGWTTISSAELEP